MNEKEKKKVVIVGAGLVGTTLSYFLSRESRFQVQVIDRMPGNAMETSFANAGRFVPVGKIRSEPDYLTHND